MYWWCAILRLLIGQESLTAVVVLGIAFLIALLLGLVLHELSHALAANALGDPTPRLTGRISLNPLQHLDPIGTLLMLTAGFGWAKPVQITPSRLRNGPVVGMATVAAAGPISNFVIAALFALPLRFDLVDRFLPTTARGLAYDQFTLSNFLALIFFYVVLFNVILGVFNLIPLAPLDGSRVAQALLPGELGRFFRQIEPYGIGILFVLLMVAWITGGQIDPVGWIMRPIQRAVLDFLL